MTDPNKTLIAVLLDRSGSMISVQSDTEGGFNAFIAEQRTQPGTATVTLAQFDDTYELVYSDLPIADVPPLTLRPRWSTALYDAVGKLVTDVGATLAAKPEDERPGTVLVVILTDGHENSSREWTHAAVQQLIRQQQDDYQWTFMFLGATLDAVEVGTGLGIAAANSMHYNPRATAHTYAAVSRATTNLRTAGHFDGFTDTDRATAAGESGPADDGRGDTKAPVL